MEFQKVVESRYSCRKFDSRPVEREQLEKILHAAKLAPTAKNLQEYHLYVVESEEILTKIDEVTPCRYDAPTVIVVTYDKNNVFVYPGEGRDSGVEDATIVATHLTLAATDAGVDNCWINLFNPDEFAKVLGLKENEEVVMMLDLGYAVEGSQPSPMHSQRKDLEETVSYI